MPMGMIIVCFGRMSRPRFSCRVHAFRAGLAPAPTLSGAVVMKVMVFVLLGVSGNVFFVSPYLA